MKRFMQFSIGVLCLSTAALVGFQLGARNAVAQAAKLVDGGIAVQGDQVYVTNVAGDVWVRSVDSVEFPRKFQGHARSLGNIYAPEK